MTTLKGLDAIGQHIAQTLNAYVSVGVGSAVPSAADESLGFEIFRAEVRNRNYDPATNTLTFSASIPDHLALSIAEVGLVTTSAPTSSDGIITTFDEGFETWSAGSWSATNSRVGGSGLLVAAATATLQAGARPALAGIRNSDSLRLAYFGNGGTATIRFSNTATDYRQFTFTPAAGYNVVNIPVSSMTSTGTPDLASADSISVIHAGSGNVLFDAIRVVPNNINEDLIERQVLSPVRQKVAGMPMDIEFPLVIA